MSTPPDKSIHALQIEATASFQGQLDTKFQNLYPRIDNRDSKNMAGYLSGELPFCSFVIGSEVEPLLLIKGLERGIDGSDETTFSEHGFRRHTVFTEAAGVLRKGLKKGTVNRGMQQLSKEIEVGSRTETVKVSRLVLESPRFARKTAVPMPYQKAREIKDKDPTRALREELVMYGPAAALMVALYRKLDEKTIMKILGNKQFNQGNSLQGRHGRTISPNHEDDPKIIHVLHNMIATPAVEENRSLPFTQESYDEALNYLQKQGWINDKQRSTLFGNINIVQTPFARAIFAGGEEYAYRLADPSYRDPSRHDYISRHYHDVATTRLLTAFLVFD